MKHAYKGLWALLFTVILIVSCAREMMETENDQVTDGAASYTAYVEGAGTKAVLD